MASLFAALPGRSNIPRTIDPYAGLQYPRITSRCAHVRQCIHTLPLKELHQFFPRLLANIFGFDYSPGWGLRQFDRRLHSDFAPILQFLAPAGDLFQLISKLEGEGFLYEFPTSCLPRPTQQALREGIIPPFYANKVQLSFSVDNTPTHVLLSALEYYIFHFVYFMVHIQISQPSVPQTHPASVSDSLYTALLDCYLYHFLPVTGTVPSALSSSPRQGSPHYLHGNLVTPPGIISQSGQPPDVHGSPGSSSSASIGSHGLLKLNGVATPSSSRTPLHPEGPGMEQTQSEIFIQVLVELWLNQNTYDGGDGDLLAQAQNQFMPNEEFLLLLRRVIKHVHYFTNGSSYSPTISILSLLISVTDTLRSSIIPLFFQKRLYHFFRYSFRHSPLDMNFRILLELWLTFLQPWRYTDPSKPSAESKESLEQLPRKWKAYVLDNLPFFSNLLIEFFGRCFSLDLTSDIGVMLLHRVAKVFSQPGLMAFVEYGESLLVDPDISISYSHPSHFRSSPISAACSVKAVSIDLNGPMFQYRPVFGQITYDGVYSLLGKVHEAKAILLQRAQSNQRHPSPPPSSPPPSPTPTSPLSPMTTTPSPASERSSWMKSFWRELVAIFSDHPSHPPLTPQDGVVRTDPQKLLKLLEMTEANLAIMFKLAPPKLYQPPSSFGASPVLGGAVPPVATPMILPGHAHVVTPPKDLSPEYVEGTCQLTPRGKMELIHGLRKCSKMSVEYLGDPLLQPIRSYENSFLVRALHRLSCTLNEKFAPQLAAIGSSKRLHCKLLLQFLTPPPPSAIRAVHAVDTSVPPSTPPGRVSQAVIPSSLDASAPPPTPRISLRLFASYYTLAQMVIFFLLLWLFSPPLWAACCLLFLVLVLYCVSRYLGSASKLKRM